MKKANNLGKYLAERGMTQAELADILDCAACNISRYVIGMREPDLYTAMTISDALEVPVGDIWPRYKMEAQYCARARRITQEAMPQ